MNKIAAITIGQSPRNDIINEVRHIFENVQIDQYGLLDGMDEVEIDDLYPKSDSKTLVSILNDGKEVKLDHDKVTHKLQQKIEELDDDYSFILLLCTARFSKEFNSNVPIYYPGSILTAILPTLVRGQKLLIVVPNKSQVEEIANFWKKYIEDFSIIHATPYGNESELIKIVDYINFNKIDIVFMDCMGYSLNMKNRIINKTGSKVILSKSVVAKLLSELI